MQRPVLVCMGVKTWHDRGPVSRCRQPREVNLNLEGVNTLTALAVLVAVITPLATMWGVNRQLRAQAGRDAILHDTQRLDEREARLRGAYAKVLRAADLIQSAIDELGWYPKGHPWQSEVSYPTYSDTVMRGSIGSVSGTQTVYHEDGDY